MRKAKLVVTFESAPSYEVRIAGGALDKLGEDVRHALECAGDDLTGAGAKAAGAAADAAAGAAADAAVGAGEAPDDSRIILLADASAPKSAVQSAKVALAQAGYHTVCINASATDALATAGELWQAFTRIHASSKEVVVALGDTPFLQLAGFVATAFSGGLACVYVPTTLAGALTMSVSDCAPLNVSGTNAQVKAELHPAFSCVDLNVLAQATPEQWQSAFALLVQAALLSSDEFFFWLCDNASALRNHSTEVLCEALVRALSFRSALSTRAEKGNASAFDCLRYGQEFAYATGASLAQGMRFSALLAQFKGLISPDIVEAQDSLLSSLGFIQPDTFDTKQALEGLLSFESLAKSKQGEGAYLILPLDIGQVERVFVPVEELQSCLEVFS